MSGSGFCSSAASPFILPRRASTDRYPGAAVGGASGTLAQSRLVPSQKYVRGQSLEMLGGGQQGKVKSFHTQELEGSPSGNYLVNHIAVEWKE